MPTQYVDVNPEETREWLESLDALIETHGEQRARHIMLSLIRHSSERNVGLPSLRSTDYINTISPDREPEFPGDETIERRIRAYIRWNAAMLVHRAQRPGVGVGGHISTYASSASLYEVGSTISSVDLITKVAGTKFSSRATPPLACMREHFSKVV